MGVPPVQCPPQRAIYCSRTLNLRSIQARPAAARPRPAGAARAPPMAARAGSPLAERPDCGAAGLVPCSGTSWPRVCGTQLQKCAVCTGACQVRVGAWSGPLGERASPRARCGAAAAQVIGYDMDYTCVNYNVEAWEGRAYSYGMQARLRRGRTPRTCAGLLLRAGAAARARAAAQARLWVHMRHAGCARARTRLSAGSVCCLLPAACCVPARAVLPPRSQAARGPPSPAPPGPALALDLQGVLEALVHADGRLTPRTAALVTAPT